MADEVTVRMDPAQIRAIETDPGTRRDTLAAARGFARHAATLAPKRTGAGAASIGPFPAGDDQSASDVSWDQQHFYMIFQEDGARDVPGRHFLRTTFETYIHT